MKKNTSRFSLRKASIVMCLSLLLVMVLAACGDPTATTAPTTTTAAATTAAATTAAATTAATTTTAAAGTTAATTTTAAAGTTTAATTTTAAAGTTTAATATTAAGGATTSQACTTASAAATGGKTFKIGIAVQAPIPALSNAIKGMKDGLASCGFVEGKNVTYELGDANGDLPSLAIIGKKFADDKKDLIVAVGTQALVNMYNTNPNTPIVFNAVTNPYVPLKDVVKTPTDHGNVTGVQAAPPVKEALEYVKVLVPGAKKVGLVWTTSEANSKVTTDQAKEEGPKLGLEIVEGPITKKEEIGTAAQALADKGIDVFLSTTDVTVVDGLESLVQVAIQTKKPIVSNDPSSAPRGATVAYGIDYYNNGVSSAKLANRILNGEAASKVDIEKEKDFGLAVNIEAASLMKVTLPDAILSKVKADFKYEKITPKK